MFGNRLSFTGFERVRHFHFTSLTLQANLNILRLKKMGFTFLAHPVCKGLLKFCSVL